MLARLIRWGVGAVVGLLSAAVALGVGELVAALFRPAAAPVIAVGNKFILLTPEPLKEFAIRRFGPHDKDVLLGSIYIGVAALAVVLGILALRWVLAGVAGLVAFGAVGVFCALTANGSRPGDVVPSVIGAGAAVVTLVGLVRSYHGQPLFRVKRAPSPPEGFGRRAFLVGTGLVAAGAALAGFGGRAVQRLRFDAGASRAKVRLPAATERAPALPAGVDLGKSGIPFITKNIDFYRVDTAISLPQLDAETWELRVHGRLDRELTLSFAELLRRPLVERYITMTCVSNEVGGPYLSTAKFLGVRLADLLREVGVHSDADQIVATSSDGMTIGTPTAVIMDGRDALLAVGMNDEPLPLQHGFPVRMVVPGLYGYVSACKWLVDLEATTFADVDTYWVQRKWSAQAPVRLESRIDTPKPFGQVKVGQPVPIAGVAWHQHVGISQVEVQVDDGAWAAARLARVPSADTWMQWASPWTPTKSGPHTLRVRAVDARGIVQEATRRGPFPSGASGWHSVVVQAR
jgi:DMSO/TMAO reductase YedYZ molybdopterin-dependent catalytic subunit